MIIDKGVLSKPVKDHLQNVYSAFAMCLLSAAGGAYLHMTTDLFGLMALVVSAGLFILLITTPHDSSNNNITNLRLGYLMGFNFFFTGIILGPVIDKAVSIEPRILPTAFLGSSVIFLCFSLASLLADDLKYLFAGGFLVSALAWIVILSLMNCLFQSSVIENIYVYGYLVIICGIILSYTQLVVEKFKNGDDDYIWHCVNLSAVFLEIFRNLLIILSSKKISSRPEATTALERNAF